MVYENPFDSILLVTYSKFNLHYTSLWYSNMIRSDEFTAPIIFLNEPEPASIADMPRSANRLKAT